MLARSDEFRPWTTPLGGASRALKLLEHVGLAEVRPGLGRNLTSVAAATVDRPTTRSTPSS